MTAAGIDTKAFRSLSYGLYIISTASKGRFSGCIVNTFQQVTSKPARVSVAINKENYTTGAILESERYEASVLSENASMELIGRFGFHSSADIDKFADTAYASDGAGIPYVTEGTCAHFAVRVIDKVDVGTHYLIIGEVEAAEPLSGEPPMTYAYYHRVKGGKTPPKASSFNPDAERDDQSGAEKEEGPRFGWRCKICGYIVKQNNLPDDFRCPMCGMGRDYFERIEL